MSQSTISSQIAAVRRMGTLSVVRKLTSRTSELDLLMLQLKEAAESLEEFGRSRASHVVAPLHTRDEADVRQADGGL